MRLATIFHRWFHIPYRLSIDRVTRGKNSRATILFIHGIGNSGQAWDKVISKLPDDITTVTIDLLGFGTSPRPKEATYNAITQARSVFMTLLLKRWKGPLIVVGHSMGALVAVELARRHPRLIRRLILCSPPFYVPDPEKKRLIPTPDGMRRGVYTAVSQRPERFIKLASVAMKYTLVNKSFNVNADNVDSYMAALHGMIINQTAFDDAQQLTVPTHIIKGALDPLIVPRNIKALVKLNSYITCSTILAGHEVQGVFVSAVIDTLKKELRKSPVKGRGTV